jgi:hypothetical protein
MRDYNRLQLVCFSLSNAGDQDQSPEFSSVLSCCATSPPSGEKLHINPATTHSYTNTETTSTKRILEIKTSNQWLVLRCPTSNAGTKEIYIKKKKQGNLTPIKVNNSTIIDSNDSEVGESQEKNSKKWLQK